MLITLARKPLPKGTVVDSCLTCGTGAINVDASRIQADDAPAGRTYNHGHGPQTLTVYQGFPPRGEDNNPAGRYPANLIAAVDVGPASRFYLRISA
jgi:hypothetical protein